MRIPSTRSTRRQKTSSVGNHILSEFFLSKFTLQSPLNAHLPRQEESIHVRAPFKLYHFLFTGF